MSTPGGIRTRSFRIESPASFLFRPQGPAKARTSDGNIAADAGFAGVGHPRPESKRRHRSKSSRLGEAEADFDRLLRWQGSNLRLAINSRVSYRSTTPEREAEGGGVEPPRPRPTRFRDGIPRQMAVLPTDDPGRTRTCTTPIKSRALYRIELRSQGCGRQGSNLQRPAFQAGALPALSYDHAEWARLESNQRPLVCKTSARPI